MNSEQIDRNFVFKLTKTKRHSFLYSEKIKVESTISASRAGLKKKSWQFLCFETSLRSRYTKDNMESRARFFTGIGRTPKPRRQVQEASRAGEATEHNRLGDSPLFPMGANYFFVTFNFYQTNFFKIRKKNWNSTNKKACVSIFIPNVKTIGFVDSN